MILLHINAVLRIGHWYRNHNYSDFFIGVIQSLSSLPKETQALGTRLKQSFARLEQYLHEVHTFICLNRKTTFYVGDMSKLGTEQRIVSQMHMLESFKHR